MTVDGFSLTKHSLSRRTESALKKKKISSLFFSPTILCLHIRVEMNSNSAARSRMAPRARSQTGKAVTRSAMLPGNQKVHPFFFSSFFFYRAAIMGTVGRGACQMETTVLWQLRFDPAKWREAAMEMSDDGVPPKTGSLLSFIWELNVPRLGSPGCSQSPCMSGNTPSPFGRGCSLNVIFRQLGYFNRLNR